MIEIVILDKIRNSAIKICKGIAVIAMAAIFLIMVVLVIDIILRLSTKSMAVRGTYELTEMAMVVIIFLSLAITQIEKEHVHVSMFIDKFQYRVKTFIYAVISTLSTAMSAITFYASTLLASGHQASGITTAVLYIPLSPFSWIMSLGLLSLTVVLLFDTVDYWIKGIKNISSEQEKEGIQ